MAMPNPEINKPFREWQIVGLIVLVLAALGLGQAVKTRVDNFPAPLLAGNVATSTETSLPHTLSLELKGQTLTVEIARTPEEQSRGLSGRPELAETGGMLFVYEAPEQPRFWMKEMHFPIDIIWLDQKQKVVEITRNLSPQTYPQTFSPRTPIKYVLEVNAGTAAKNNLQIGDLIHFSLPETL